jgi:MFS family permease
VSLTIIVPVTSPARDRPSLASFWNDLPRDGKLLLSTVAIETLGTGLVLPCGFIYLHEVRGFTIETAGSLLAVPAIVAMTVVGPAGALIDRLGARRIILAGMSAQMLGNVMLAFSSTPLHLRGRYNAVMAGAFQLAAVTGPVVAGVMLGAWLNVEFIGMLILGCAVMAFIALAVEHRIPAQANGIKTAAAELSQV